MISISNNPHQYLLEEVYCLALPDSENNRISAIIKGFTKIQAELACRMLHMDFQQRDMAPVYIELSADVLERILLTVQCMNSVFLPEKHSIH